jgi:autotransporter-associated beta strand protein
MKTTRRPLFLPSLLSESVSGVACLACVGISVGFSLTTPARGATIYWDGLSTDWGAVGSWSTAVGATTPNPAAVPGAADIADFSINTITNTAQTVNLNAARSVQGLVFEGTNTATTSLLAGGTNRILTLGSSGITVNSLAGAVSIGSATEGQQVAVTLGAAQSWTNNSANLLTVTNGVTNGGFGLTLAGTGNTTLGGIVSGSGGLTQAGTGNLTLTGTNTYSGGTTINAGSVTINAANNLGSGTITSIFGGSGRLIFGADGVNLTQSINNVGASRFQVAAGNTSTISGQISNQGQLQKFGAGTLVLDAANIYSGKTVINAGTLKLGTGGSITANNFDVLGGTFDLSGKTQTVTSTLVLGNATVSGSISGGGTIDVGTTFSLVQGSISSTMAGAGSVSKTGSTTVTLAGTNTYTGATNVTAGKLILNGSTSASSAVGVSSGAILAGSGTVGGDITIASGGVLAPGNSPGVLAVAGTTTFSSGSIFEWEIDTAQANPTTNRGTAYDGLNTSALAGSGAIFKIMLTGTQDFTDDFWNQNRTWTDIFKSADGSSILSSWASVFSGGFQYSYNGQTVAPTSQGFFTTTGSSLTWSAVPEPSNLLAGILAASALLRRRRNA